MGRSASAIQPKQSVARIDADSIHAAGSILQRARANLGQQLSLEACKAFARLHFLAGAERASGTKFPARAAENALSKNDAAMLNRLSLELLVESIAGGMLHQTGKRAEARVRQSFAKLVLIIDELNRLGFETLQMTRTAKKALRDGDEETLEHLITQLGFVLKQCLASQREPAAREPTR